MKQDEFRRQLTATTPDMPEHFVQHVDLILEKIVAQEENVTASNTNMLPFMGRYISKRAMVVIIALMIMLMSLTAYALTQWKSFEQLADIVGDNVSEEAGELMQ